MRVVEPVHAAWRASLALEFELRGGKSVLARRSAEGPLAVQKALYPEGPAVSHAILVHPPGGIAGGDELAVDVHAGEGAAALLTTPGAAKWYRTSGPWAKQRLAFRVDGALEWLPRETIVFDGALAELECEVHLATGARYIGWEIVCLGRTGSGERFARGTLRLDTRLYRGGKPLWIERGTLQAGERLLASPVGLAGNAVFGTLVATGVEVALAAECRRFAATTLLPGVMVARYLGDSTEEALQRFAAIWKLVRPAVMGRPAEEPRIWRT